MSQTPGNCPADDDEKKIPAAPFVFAAAGLAIVLVGVFLLLLIIIRSMELSRNIPHSRSQKPPGSGETPVTIQLQTSPTQDLATLRRESRILLNSYGWVDRETAKVRVPIEQAMGIAAEKGFPTRTSGRGSGPENKLTDERIP